MDKMPLAKHREEIKEATTMWSLTLQFGWTPKEIRECDPNDLEIYKMMLSGYTQGNRGIK